MTEQMELVQQAEVVEIKDLNILDQERLLYKAMTVNVAVDAKKVIASIKDLESCEKAVAWCNERKDDLQKIDSGITTKVRKVLHKKWQEFCSDLNAYIDPTNKAIKDVMAAVTKKRNEIKEQLLAKEARMNDKLLAKAADKQEQKVQTLIDTGKEKQAMIMAKRPVPFTPVKLEMPKIKGAVWKKTYIVRIEDFGQLLACLAKKTQYHNLIDHNALIGKLETLATQLGGNMGEFKGIKIFEAENPAVGGNR